MSEPAHLDLSVQLTLEDVVSAADFMARLQISQEACVKLDTSRAEVVHNIVTTGARIYGFNTGFGDNRNRQTIPTELLGHIQDNLILSHAAGYGASIDGRVVRAAMAIRARTLAIGHSAIRSKTLKSLVSLFNSGLVPHIPTFGSVGASGDLAPLSHLALVLMGRGSVVKGGSETGVSRALLNEHDVENLSYRLESEFDGVVSEDSVFGPKEGLALNNGTSFMAAWLSLAVTEVENLIDHLNLALALNIEAQCGVIDAFRPEVQSLRPHSGLQECAQKVWKHLSDSRLVMGQGDVDGYAVKTRTMPSGVIDNTQDDYCLRAGTVVHGTAFDAVNAARRVVEIEINSVTDNPVFFGGTGYSGAHFHGMPLSFAADQLRTAMAIVGGVSERRIAKLLNDKRNYGLPRHLVVNDPQGVKSGWMISQYCAASMVNELKTRSMPYCVGNVTTGNESEDYVSMGANACRAAYEMVTVLRGIVAIELATAVRALLIRIGKIETPGDLSGWENRVSTRSQSIVQSFVENQIEVWHSDDRPLDPLIKSTSLLIQSKKLFRAL